MTQRARTKTRREVNKMPASAERTFAPVNSPLFWHMLRTHKDECQRVKFTTYQGAMDFGARKICEGYIVTVGQYERLWNVFYW